MARVSLESMPPPVTYGFVCRLLLEAYKYESPRPEVEAFKTALDAREIKVLVVSKMDAIKRPEFSAAVDFGRFHIYTFYKMRLAQQGARVDIKDLIRTIEHDVGLRCLYNEAVAKYR